MKWSRTATTSCGVLALFGGVAIGQPDPGSGAGERQEGANLRGDSVRPSQYGLRGPRGVRRRPVPPEVVEARRERLRAFREQSDRTREDRIRTARDEARARWGDILTSPEVAEELRLHAWRLARVEGIQRLADEEGNAPLVGRCEDVFDREIARHERRMEALKASLTAPSSVSSASVPAASPPAPAAT
ncbi:MAG: hypothetical protein JW751_15130 [Polyangiaceae bacterium]|nr:hypothetical protein [Polyangiaceae bacterium]